MVVRAEMLRLLEDWHHLPADLTACQHEVPISDMAIAGKLIEMGGTPMAVCAQTSCCTSMKTIPARTWSWKVQGTHYTLWEAQIRRQMMKHTSLSGM